MKNTKLSIGLIACLLSLGSLAGCSKVQASNDGVLLRYSIGGVEQEPITADKILAKSYDDSSKYQSIFDIIYSVLVKNYFNKEYTVDYHGETIKLGKEQLGDISDYPASDGTIYQRANLKVKDDTTTAQTNADANGTTYKKEFEAILESKGVNDEDELRQKYVEELEKEVFEKNFYTYNIEELKLGSSDSELSDFWPGYFKDQMPYHVSHILVKVSDDSATNYANGTISEANAKRLSTLVSVLEKGSQSFQDIAYNYSDDTGSAELSGDLGIMDTSTSFVNEFKLGIYAYENAFGNVKDTDKIKMNTTIMGNFDEAVEKSFDGIPTISKEIFAELGKAAATETDKDNKPVLEGSANFYPRNIIYNKYLNRHSFAFIENTNTDEADATATTGYHKFPEINNKVLLSAKVSGVWRPILVVRAGTSDYQGLHFIVVNRSPYDINLGGVSQTDYYTTFYPDQRYYPTDSSNSKIKSYINFSSPNTDISATRKRAEELASKLKSFDSDRLSKYIFQKFMKDENVKIQQTGLKNSLEKWINTSVLKAEDERKENWEKTWAEYIDSLSRQGAERSKLIPQVCRLAYKDANTSEKTLEEYLMEVLDAATPAELETKAEYQELISLIGITRYNNFKGLKLDKTFKLEGGPCNDGKTHN